MGESPEITDPLAALEAAHEAFEAATDFTVGVEEEFAILDPRTLDLAPRFESFAAAAAAGEGPLKGHVAGELIRSEVEVRTGRRESFPAAVDAIARRRVDLVDLADRLGVRLAGTGTHPFSRWQDQQVIDTPHYHLVEQTLRYVAWRNNTFGIHVHTGVRGADRAVAVMDAMRTVLPELLAASASSPWLEGVRTHLHSTRTQIFTRAFPRCGIPEPFGDWRTYADHVRFLVETGSIVEHTQIWWSVRLHQSFPTVETRICDAQPEFSEAVALAGLMVALTADFARRYDEGRPLPSHPGRQLEENLWRAIRWGMDGRLIDLEQRREVPARARLDALLESVSETAGELGVAPFLTPLEHSNAAQRYSAQLDDGATPAELWPLVVERTHESAREWLSLRQAG
ncbi:MAG TPA: YbdK family carboxylate-amine ligase [Gaiellales bacterium]|nr:YbdK family carboxylate-amine ligase [Gaiellales bacterium]